MLDLITLIKTVGYLGLFGIVFAESGLFVGFFLPGDSLLFSAGILASQGYGTIGGVIGACFLGAVLGDSFGYWFGRRVGPAIFKREDSVIFHKNHISRASQFYARHGAKTIVIARFVPVVRTFAPILAGVGQMNYRTFFLYNLLGGMLWAIGIPLLGYYLGTKIPHIERYLIPGIIIIILVSIAPGIGHFVRDWRETRRRQGL